VRVAAVGNTVCDETSLRIEEYLERLGQVLDEAASMHHFHTAMSIPPQDHTIPIISVSLLCFYPSRPSSLFIALISYAGF
jgi:hypothetical protein